MRTPSNLLRFLARSVFRYLGGEIIGDFAVEVLLGALADFRDWWNKEGPVASLRPIRVM